MSFYFNINVIGIIFLYVDFRFELDSNITIDKYCHVLVVTYQTGLGSNDWIYCTFIHVTERLCGLVVRVPGYRSRGPGFDSRRYQIF
jgi:hypothetical protein